MDPRHNDGANLAFADGHVKWYTGSSILSGFKSQSLLPN